MLANMIGQRRTWKGECQTICMELKEQDSERTKPPFPIDQAATSQAFPFARTAREKFSVGQSQGAVSRVAPNTNVKMPWRQRQYLPD